MNENLRPAAGIQPGWPGPVIVHYPDGTVLPDGWRWLTPDEAASTARHQLEERIYGD